MQHSMTMYYKFGLEKALLRSGKVVGVTAAVLLFFQVVLVSRFKILGPRSEKQGCASTQCSGRERIRLRWEGWSMTV